MGKCCIKIGRLWFCQVRDCLMDISKIQILMAPINYYKLSPDTELYFPGFKTERMSLKTIFSCDEPYKNVVSIIEEVTNRPCPEWFKQKYIVNTISK